MLTRAKAIVKGCPRVDNDGKSSFYLAIAGRRQGSTPKEKKKQPFIAPSTLS